MLKNYFFSASAAHTSQPCQGNLGGLLVKPCSDRLVDHIAGITALATGAVGGAYALWPRPLEQKLSPEAVRACIALIAEVPTEYAARKLYRECLVIKGEAERVARWQEHGKAVADRNQRCSELGYWKPGSTLGSECSIPEPPKPQR